MSHRTFCHLVLTGLVLLAASPLAAQSRSSPRVAPSWTEPYSRVGNFPLIPALGGTTGALIGEGLTYGVVRQVLMGTAIGVPLAIGIQALAQHAIDRKVDWGTAFGSGLGATLAPIAVTALLGAAAPGIPIFLASMAGSMVGTWVVQQLRYRLSTPTDQATGRGPDQLTLLDVRSGTSRR